MTLTGRTRHVHYKPWFGAARLVLQVEESYEHPEDVGGHYIEVRDALRWRNANVEDLSTIIAQTCKYGMDSL